MAKAAATTKFDADAHQPRRVEVLRGGVHGQPEPRPRDEGGEQHEHHDAHQEAAQVDLGDGQRADVHDAAQDVRGGEGDLDGPAGEPRQEEHAVLQDLPHGERGQQERHLRRPAQRPVGDPLDEQADDDGAQDHGDDGDRQRHAGGQAEDADVGGHHHHVAVREVDEAQDAEDERQADGHERVEAARAERVDDLLQEVLAHARPLMRGSPGRRSRRAGRGAGPRRHPRA